MPKPALRIKVSPQSGWPERLVELAANWRRSPSATARERIRSEMWVLMVGALELDIRRQATRRQCHDDDFAYDLAVQKARDLFAEFGAGSWRPQAYAPGQVRKYFMLLARNAVIDHVRSRRGRQQERTVTLDHCPESVGRVAADESAVDRERLAQALVRCAGGLTRRSRAIWFLRVFLEKSSREIGRHPAVDMRATAVDMALFRIRRRIRSCLQASGFDATDFGTGVFTACWEAFRSQGPSLVETDREEGGT